MKLSISGVKDNVDAELVLNAITEISNYNKVVIIAGDGDYACLIEYLLNQNKLEKLIIPDWEILFFTHKIPRIYYFYE